DGQTLFLPGLHTTWLHGTGLRRGRTGQRQSVEDTGMGSCSCRGQDALHLGDDVGLMLAHKRGQWVVSVQGEELRGLYREVLGNSEQQTIGHEVSSAFIHLSRTLVTPLEQSCEDRELLRTHALGHLLALQEEVYRARVFLISKQRDFAAL